MPLQRPGRNWRRLCGFGLLFLTPPASAGELEFVPDTALLSSLSLREPHEGPLNPGNRVTQLPQQSLALEVRPDWRLSWSAWKLTARPRLKSELDVIESPGIQPVKPIQSLRWSEAYLSWAHETLSIDYGLQNFQWGPAESASPSNRLFRDTIQSKDNLYLVKGRHLARLSWIPSSRWSQVLLGELSDNGDPEPEPGEPFAHKALLKSELSWSGGSQFGGLVLGWRERQGSWLGSYLQLEPLEGFFWYLDSSLQRGSLASYPVRDSSGRYFVFRQSRKTDAKLHSSLVSGLRYAFENGNDLRVEWIYQEQGYSLPELGSAYAALSSPDPAQYALLAAQGRAARQSGLEFPSRHYLYSSLRLPNCLGVKDWSLYLRILRSLQDGSLTPYLSSETAVNEHGSLLVSLGGGFGREGSELRGSAGHVLTFAYRHAW